MVILYFIIFAAALMLGFILAVFSYRLFVDRYKFKRLAKRLSFIEIEDALYVLYDELGKCFSITKASHYDILLNERRFRLVSK